MSDTYLHAKAVSLDFATKMSTPPAGQERFFRDRKGKIKFRALDKLTFEANPGDRIALIGANGAGKTTLLRTLSGIYAPSSGEVRSRGHMRILLSPALGVNLEATGMENIAVLGHLNGMSKPAIQAAIPGILDFAELGEFINMPMQTYSAGMRMRLVYAVVTSASPDILLLDEVIGVGDRSFVEKATRRRKEFMSSAKVLVLASHADNLIRQFCNRAIWIDNGRIVIDDRDVVAVMEEYKKFSKPDTQSSADG